MYEIEKYEISAFNNSVAKWWNILFLREIYFDLTGKSKVALYINCTQPGFITCGLKVKGYFASGGMFIINRIFDLPLLLFANEIFRGKN